MSKLVIWTVNLDKKKSRSRGRKIPRRFAVPNVKLQEIVDACRDLGIEVQVERDKKHPRCWWEESGRVVIKKEFIKEHTKTKLMIEISKRILESRKTKTKHKK